MSASSARRTGVGRSTGSVMDNDQMMDDTPAADNNSAEPAYVATGLPSGLSISADGVISGTVISLGTHTVTISTTDPARDPHSVTFDWIVL